MSPIESAALVQHYELLLTKHNLHMKKLFAFAAAGLLLVSCGRPRLEKKGFQVAEVSENEEGKKVVGLKIDSLKFATQPRNVLSTKYPEHRITPIYKINYHKKTGKPFTGSNSFHYNWREDHMGNRWNGNYIPGFEATYGYNMVNVSHYNVTTKKQDLFFDEHVLIKTLYYPANTNDSVDFKPVNRNYYMVSCYDEDTNKDGYLTVRDLRRFYLFDIAGNKKNVMVPNNYDVMSSEYDVENDYMYIFAKLDKNENGQKETDEPMHIFYIDLKDPNNNGRVYPN